MTEPKLHEASFLTREDLAEGFSDLLMDQGVMSVSTEDADADSPEEKPLFGEPGLEPEVQAWTRTRLKLLYEEGFDVEGSIREAAARLGIEPPVLEGDAAVPDADWVRVTQAQFGPVKVSDRLWIVPSWNEPPVPDALNIRLDPGVAFGTGSHPTTHLCLQWLDENCPTGASVLDYGCGTGILAIAAAKVGAARVTGTDIDPQAVEAANFNASENHVDARFVLPKDLAGDHYDIVIANILCNPLKVLAPALVERVAPGGTLVLSGLLSHQAEEIRAHYASLGIELALWREDGGWICLAGRKAKSSHFS